jgi:hypothetical protein
MKKILFTVEVIFNTIASIAGWLIVGEVINVPPQSLIKNEFY